MPEIFNIFGSIFYEIWNTLRQVAVLLLSGVSLTALMIVLEAFFPRWIGRTRLAIEKQPGASFLLGLVNLIFFGAITLVFFLLARSASPIFLGPALLIDAPLVAATLIGTAGVIAVAGPRLFPGFSGRRRSVYTLWLLMIACLTPLAGWFLLTSFIAMLGFGGFLLGFLRYRNHGKSPQPIDSAGSERLPTGSGLEESDQEERRED